jgi:ethylbenzene dioxygenase beta subunit
MSANPAHNPSGDTLVDAGMLAELTAFLYREARLLDTGNVEGWLSLLTDDVHYFMPAQPAVYSRNLKNRSVGDKLAFYDDDLDMIKRRIARMIHPTAWSEDPPTRVIHQISNIEAFNTGTDGTWRVLSVAVVFRSRNEADQDTLWARREDLVRRVDGKLKLAKRHVTLAHNVLLGKNLNVFI